MTCVLVVIHLIEKDEENNRRDKWTKIIKR
jgi:hypothetical protein